MVVDFSQTLYPEKPVLVLEDLDETPLQTLGYAFGLTGNYCFNEVSTLEFDLPAYVEGVKTPHYDDVVGMRIVDLIGWGRFILSKPKVSQDGVHEIKHCTAYSLEYEWTYKKISVAETVYQFWNPLSPGESILGIMLEQMPAWSVGYVSSDLLARWRNISAEYKNVYEFAKNDVQVKYGCVFDFDTYQRVVNVYSTNDSVLTDGVFLSTQNLLKNVDVEEDTESIVTALDVNGAEGVDIRMVNPMGINMIYNLDYPISAGMVPASIIPKWQLWKDTFTQKQTEYYILMLEYRAKISEKLTTTMALTDKREVDLASIEATRSVNVAYLATLDPTSQEYADIQDIIDQCDEDIANLQTDISAIQSKIDSIQAELTSLQAQMKLINQQTAFSYVDGGTTHYNFGFTADDLLVLDRLFKEDSISESSFVLNQTASYTTDGKTKTDLSGLSITIQTTATDDEYKNELIALSVGGNVDLLHRPMVKGSLMIEAGWTDYDIGEDDICTVFSSTYSTSDGLTAMNFTPIQSNSNGDLIDILGPEDFDAYCFAVIDGYSEDTRGLKIGKTFTGETAIDDASEEAEHIHELHEKYFLIYGQIQEVVGLDNYRLFGVDGGVFSMTGSATATGQLTNAVIHMDTTQNNGGHSCIVTASIGDGAITVDGGTTQFHNGCLSVTGTWTSESDDLAQDPGLPNVYKTGTTLSLSISSASLYFTTDTTEFETYSVEWELYKYGQDALSKLAWPSYSFSLSSANFLAIDDYRSFAQRMTLGHRCYVDLGDKGILEPILVRAKVAFDDPASLELEFGNTFNLSDSSFALTDLLEKGVSMGKTLDVNKINYNAFVNSGAANSVKNYMTSALDVAKQTILSGSDMAVSWDRSGFWLRKYNSQGGYDNKQIGMINNSIVFTRDGFATAEMAIGEFYDPRMGTTQWGIVAPSIVGTLIAGQTLWIESSKSDNGVLSFRVDSDGASLHNANFSLYDNTAQGDHGRIDLGSKFGIIGGVDGVAPLFTYEQGVISGVATKQNNSVTSISGLNRQQGDEPNANFWLDMNGDIWLRGTVYATDGEFTGIVKAKDYQLADGTSIWENGRFKGSALDLSGIGISASEPAADGTVTLSISLNNGQQSGGAHGLIQIDGNVDISGSLSADALYAHYGDVADLTVDELSTTRRISLYLNRDTSDDNYIRVRGQKLSFITGTTDGTVESALNPNGQKLYWEKDISGATIIDGWPFINGGTERVYLTTVQTLYPVSVYKYTELVKRSIEFEMDTEATDPSKRYYIPIDVFGAGTGDGKGRGYIIKKADGLHMEYEAENGKMCEIHWAMDGFLDFYGLRRTVALDCTAWPAAGETGQIVETLEGLDEPITYDVQLSEDEKTLTFIYADGVEFRVDLP